MGSVYLFECCHIFLDLSGLNIPIVSYDFDDQERSPRRRDSDFDGQEADFPCRGTDCDDQDSDFRCRRTILATKKLISRVGNRF